MLKALELENNDFKVLSDCCRDFDLAFWTKGVQIGFYEPEREIDPELFTYLSSQIQEDISQYRMSSKLKEFKFEASFINFLPKVSNN